jgi:predicted Rossmann-fold nucleotide-binding protein
MSIPVSNQPKPSFKKIAVFCGSSIGNSKNYAAQTVLLGEEMVKRNIGLVYGGGNVGLMGVIAETVYRGLGCDEESVVGVIPDYLEDREVR